jgi:hypothetical protein
MQESAEDFMKRMNAARRKYAESLYFKAGGK